MQIMTNDMRTIRVCVCVYCLYCLQICVLYRSVPFRHHAYSSRKIYIQPNSNEGTGKARERESEWIREIVQRERERESMIPVYSASDNNEKFINKLESRAQVLIKLRHGKFALNKFRSERKKKCFFPSCLFSSVVLGAHFSHVTHIRTSHIHFSTSSSSESIRSKMYYFCSLPYS